ncbi:unnamed protein product [Toxocara canis]|uniref:Chondroitin proteoglycan 2 n=1 Tax=Toxocara canis TaxID=6265 RepID=A0A183UM03_TOXCA|nr:unnamed protein product [Toxocara canis]
MYVFEKVIYHETGNGMIIGLGAKLITEIVNQIRTKQKLIEQSDSLRGLKRRCFAWVESTSDHFEYGFHREGGIVCLATYFNASHNSSDFPGGGFCLRRRDGPYAVGCVAQFVTCRSKVSYVMFCRDGLFFDEHLGKCVPKWYASSCRGHGHQRPPQGLVPPFVPVQPEESRFCKKREDGNYNIGCTSCYIACSGKHAYAMECPAGLVLDEASDSCVEKSYVTVCGGVPTTTPTTTTVTTTTTTTTPPASEPTTEATTPTHGIHPSAYSSNFFSVKLCHHHHNGFFGMGCSPRYFVCIDGRPSYRACRYGFAFDEVKQICVPKCEVRKCGCRPRPTTTTTTTTEETTTTTEPASEATTTEPASEATTTEPASEATTPATTTRSPVKPCRHHNGFFGIGCSSRYVVCIDGLPTYHTCRRELKFDERRKICLPKKTRHQGSGPAELCSSHSVGTGMSVATPGTVKASGSVETVKKPNSHRKRQSRSGTPASGTPEGSASPLSERGDSEEGGVLRNGMPSSDGNRLLSLLTRMSRLLRHRRVRILGAFNLFTSIINAILMLVFIVLILQFLVLTIRRKWILWQHENPCLYRYGDWGECSAKCWDTHISSKPPTMKQYVLPETIIEAHGKRFARCPMNLRHKYNEAPCNFYKCPKNLSSFAWRKRCFFNDATKGKKGGCYQIRNIEIPGDELQLIRIDANLTRPCADVECRLMLM